MNTNVCLGYFKRSHSAQTTATNEWKWFYSSFTVLHAFDRWRSHQMCINVFMYALSIYCLNVHEGGHAYLSQTLTRGSLHAAAIKCGRDGQIETLLTSGDGLLSGSLRRSNRMLPFSEPCCLRRCVCVCVRVCACEVHGNEALWKCTFSHTCVSHDTSEIHIYISTVYSCYLIEWNCEINCENHT
jgi:hypothetical protein